MKITNIKGMEDLLPERMLRWKEGLEKIENLALSYGYLPIKTPILQRIELFKRVLGEASDIVNKEMYSLTDKGGRELVLKPEETASVARMFNEHNLSFRGLPQRYYYFSSYYRQEKPQKGRLREFHQFGIESIGSSSPFMDVEVITLYYEIIKLFDIDVKIRINSLGCKKCRPLYRKELEIYLRDRKDDLCDDCKRRLETNPLRVLDCKNEKCIRVTADAPKSEDFLCDDCRKHHEAVLESLDELNIPYVKDPKLVRGLDYYNRTIFEGESSKLGAQSAVGGGGRYDYLMEQLEWKPMPAVGFAIGMERLMMASGKEETSLPPIDLFIAAIGKDSIIKGMDLARELRKKGFSVFMDLSDRSLKSQMKQANKKDARFVIIIGDTEISENKVIIKDMANGSQKDIDMDVETISKEMSV